MKKLVTILALTFTAHPTTTYADAAQDKRFEECRQKLIKAQKLGVLHNLDLPKGKMPYVVAGPTFFDVPIETKQGFADTINCFFMTGDTSKFISFDILDYKTGKPVASYFGGKLKMK